MFAVYSFVRRRAVRMLAAFFALGALLAPGPGQANSFDVKTFRPWAGYGIPNGVWLTGDINADGRSDIVHAVQGTDYVHTWTSRGDGTFAVGTFRPWAGYGIPNGIWLTADLNGDGRTDIVHAVQGTDYVHTWLSRGDGTFQVGTFRPWAGYGIPNGVWLAADINADGRTDLVHAVQGTDYVHTWTSRGDGTFQVGTFRPWAGYGIPNGLWIVADINGDRRADLVHAVQGTDYVHTWTSRGDGTFAVGTFRPWAGYGVPNGLWLPADINGDGRTDIVHAVQGTDYVHTWTSRGDGTFQVGTFRPWAGYGIPNGVWLTGDLDADGKADILHAVQGTDYAHTWLSRGDGTFAVGTFRPWRGYAIPNGLWLAADITGDRRTDIVHAVQGTDYVHPWISLVPKPFEIALEGNGIEVTQSIQDMNLSVPLVTGKRTMVRAYLKNTGTTPVSLRGDLVVERPSVPNVTIASSNATTVDPSLNNNLRAKREDMTRSLNFELPAALLTGTATFRVGTVRDAAGAAVPCSDCSTVRRSVAFNNTVPMRLRVLGLRYQTGTPPVSHQPRPIDYQLIESWLRRAFPVSSLAISSVTVNATTAWPFTCNDANAQGAAIRATDVATGTDARTHYYALVHNGGGFMRGCTAAIPNAPAPATVASGPTGPTGGSFAWDTDGSFGDWYTGHELGHTYGRLHPGSGCGDSADDTNEPFTGARLSGPDGAFTGLDMGDGGASIAARALPGETWRDLMSYCDNQWISHYSYRGVLDRLAAENALPGGAPEAGPVAGASASAGGSVERIPAILAGHDRPQTVQAATAHPPDAAVGSPPERIEVGAAAAPPLAEAEAPVPAEVAPPPALGNGPLDQLVGARTAVLASGRVRPLPPELTQVQVREGDLVSVIATVNLTRQTGALRAVNRVGRGLQGAPVGRAEALVRFLDDGGRVVQSFPVSVNRNTDIPPGEDQTALIDAVVPFVAGARRLEVVLGDKVLDGRSVAASGPEVGAPRSVAGPGDGPPEIEWDARHAENRNLEYAVQVSTDDRRTWSTVAVGLKDPRFRPDPTNYPGAREIAVRVIANDGVNTTISEPRSVRLAN